MSFIEDSDEMLFLSGIYHFGSKLASCNTYVLLIA